MLIPLPGRFGPPAEMLPTPFRRDQDAWRLRRVPVAQDLDGGEYGLLDPRLVDEPKLPKDGLLSAPPPGASAAPVRLEPVVAPPQPAFPSDALVAANGGATGGPTETSGVVGPESSRLGRDTGSRLYDVFRALLGLGPARDDLAEDERGNVHAPEVSALIQDIVAATKADEPALRRRIDEMFRGEARTAYWFHLNLSDLLAGDPPEEILEELSYHADERFRDQRASIGHFAGLVDIPVILEPPTTRPFTHLNDPVPPDPNMENFRRLLQDYDINQEKRAWERASADPANLKTLWGKHRYLQGAEFEGVARGHDAAFGHQVGPRLKVDWRTYDHMLLDRNGNLLHPVESKSGQGRIPKKQREFDATIDPPVVYRKEKDVLSDGVEMLSRYDRLWTLRNPPQKSGPPTGRRQWWPAVIWSGLQATREPSP